LTYLQEPLILKIRVPFLFVKERKGERYGERGFEYASGKKHLYKVDRETEWAFYETIKDDFHFPSDTY
jgi:hypothetical protein